jgi:hypothetical protein
LEADSRVSQFARAEKIAGQEISIYFRLERDACKKPALLSIELQDMSEFVSSNRHDRHACIIKIVVLSPKKVPTKSDRPLCSRDVRIFGTREGVHGISFGPFGIPELCGIVKTKGRVHAEKVGDYPESSIKVAVDRAITGRPKMSISGYETLGRAVQAIGAGKELLVTF